MIIISLWLAEEIFIFHSAWWRTLSCERAVYTTMVSTFLSPTCSTVERQTSRPSKSRNGIREYRCLVQHTYFHILFLSLFFFCSFCVCRIREKYVKVANDPATSAKDAKAAAARAVTITPEMVHAVVTALNAEAEQKGEQKGVPHRCVVMLTEADGQAARMFRQNDAHLLITEDSDALLYGCDFVLLLLLLFFFLFFSFLLLYRCCSR
jgi:hypothetical protein